MKTSSLRFSGLVLAAGLILQLASCVSTEREATSTPSSDPRATYTPPPAGERNRIGNKTVLNTVSTTHIFSDPEIRDNFVLQLRGPRVLTAQAHLIVLNNAGDTLRHEVLPARALLREQALNDPRAASVREQEIAILQGMNSFFADAHFTQPAVGPGAAQPAELDLSTWSALRQDPGTIGFDYISAGGAERRLVFARKLGRAVIISQ